MTPSSANSSLNGKAHDFGFTTPRVELCAGGLAHGVVEGDSLRHGSLCVVSLAIKIRDSLGLTLEIIHSVTPGRPGW